MERGRLTDAKTALDYLYAGQAVVTFQSLKSGAHYTYRISAPSATTERGGRTVDHDTAIRFVAVLTGPDNTQDYSYVGTIAPGRHYVHGRAGKARLDLNAPSVRAFDWVYQRLLAGVIPDGVEICHEGRCGRCGRTLTVPESVVSGYGPECAERIRGAA